VASASGSSANPHVQMWRADYLDGLELLKATVTEFAFHPHAHEEFFIALTEDGLVTPTYRGDTHVIGPGDLIVLNPEETHAGGPPAHCSWTYRALYPHPDLVRGLMAEFPGDRPAMAEFSTDVVRDRQIAAGLRRFHRLAERPESSPLDQQANLVETLVLPAGLRPSPTRHGVVSAARGGAPVAG